MKTTYHWNDWVMTDLRTGHIYITLVVALHNRGGINEIYTVAKMKLKNYKP